MIYKLLTLIWRRASIFNDKVFRKGGDFSDWLSLEELGFSKERGNKYQPSSGIIKRVFRELKPCKADTIVDIGCGKGRAMYMLSQFEFGAIEGYDLSSQMVDVANSNFAKTGINDRCRAFLADAAEYKDYNKYNYFYAFNPVPEIVFEKLMGNIVENIEQNPRECFFVYLNPVYDKYIKEHTPFKLDRIKRGIVRWNDVYVYKMK